METRETTSDLPRIVASMNSTSIFARAFLFWFGLLWGSVSNFRGQTDSSPRKAEPA